VRSAPLKALACGLLLLSCSIVLTRTIKGAMLRQFGGPRLRLGQSVDALPDIARSADVLVLGTSKAYQGLSVRRLDDRLREHELALHSYNWAQCQSGAELNVLIAQRAAAAFDEAGRKVPLAIVELELGVLTSHARKTYATTIDDRAILLRARDLPSILVHSPSRGVELLATWALGSPGPSARDIFEGIMFLDEQAARLWQILTLTQYFTWRSSTRGDFAWEDLARLPVAKERIPITQRQLTQLVDEEDVLELDFDEESVENFIEEVRIVQTFAQHTILILLPRNSKWVNPSAAAWRRTHSLIARVRRETHADILDLYTNPREYDETDFVDLLHLADTGSERFSTWLADHVADRLKASGGS
jgi:hypothetical protein